MYRKLFHLLPLLLCAVLNASAHSADDVLIIYEEDFSLVGDESEMLHTTQAQSPVRTFFKLRQRFKNANKITSAAMAFPIPFGIVGLHRIYLGTKAYVPVAYIATVGGCFGILPLIDFFSIVFAKDTEPFINNPHVFMWAK